MNLCRRIKAWRFLTGLIVLGFLLVSSGACAREAETTGSTTTGTSVPATETKATTEALREPLDVFHLYAQAWERGDYASMYALSEASLKERLDESSFVQRYENIFQGIEATNLVVKEVESQQGNPALDRLDENTALISFQVSMDTLAGPVVLDDYQMRLVRESVGDQLDWRVSWQDELIFPDMGSQDKVQARILFPRRGQLYDRYGRGLAVNGELITIGIAPGKFEAAKDEAIPEMAEILGISEERIRRIVQDATNPDWFYPIVTLASDANDLSARLTAFDGVLYQKTAGRVYPAGASAGRLVGYIGPITAEELKNRPDQDYSTTDMIGKMGLEQVYEERLRGHKGGEITLVDSESGQLKDVIARQEAVNGEDVALTIDVKAQIALEEAMHADAGAAAAVNPLTGEILALVSTPSFDPNLFQTYVPDAVQQTWNEAEKSVFINRFNTTYAPGSVFKLVTAAIGLKAGTLDPEEALPISGKNWQPDASWGNYQITRVKDIGRPVNLADALLYSDNIYFARQALRTGAEAFAAGAADFAIGEELPIAYPFSRSQLSNNGLSNDVLLADTAYGQGEVLVSPLHLALIYSTLATEGNLMKPSLELSLAQPQIWKEQAILSADVPLLAEMLTQVVENPDGTAYSRTPAQNRMLGKTGTAELKETLDDTDAEENGWFVAMNIDQPRLTIAMMIEDVKERHGSHYVVPLVKQVMDQLLDE